MPTIPIPQYEPHVGVPRGGGGTMLDRPAPVANTQAGLVELGTAIVDVAQKENARRDQIDLMQYDQKLSALDQQHLLGDADHPGALRQMGVNAAGITKATLASWDKEAVPLMPKLRSAESQARAMQLRDVRRQDAQERLVNHEFQQGQVADDQTTKASIEAYTNEAGMAGGDAKAREAALARLRNVTAAYATRNGLSKEAAAQFIGNAESNALTGIAENMMATDPMGAQAFVENEPRLLFDDRAALNQKLAPIINDAADFQKAQDIIRAGYGAISAPSPDGPKAVSTNVTVIQSDYRSLAANYGARITSMQRTPQEQATLVREGASNAVNSQHLRGTACDFVVPPQNAAAFIEDCKKRGYQVIDERAKGGTGPHIHVQLPAGQLLPPAAPQTKAEALAVADHIADPRSRAEVERNISQHFDLVEAQKQDADRVTMQSIYTKVWNARDSALPLSKVLSPDEYVYAVQNNHAGGLENMLTPNKSDNTGSLSAMGEIQQQFYLAATGDKKAIRFVNAFNPWDTTKYKLTNEQRNTLSNQQIAFGKHDPQAIADLTQTGKLAEEAMFNTFGDMTHPVDSPEEERLNQFRGALTQSIQAFKAQNKGAPPTQDQVQIMSDTLLLQTQSGARVFQEGSGGTRKVAVPAEFAAQIRAADKTATDAEIARVYLLAKARKLL